MLYDFDVLQQIVKKQGIVLYQVSNIIFYEMFSYYYCIPHYLLKRLNYTKHNHSLLIVWS